MVPMNVEAEIRDLKRRVGDLECSFRFLSQQINNLYNDLLAFRARTDQWFEKFEARLEKLEGSLDGVEGTLDTIEASINSLRKELPLVVASTMRQVLLEFEVA
jgi:archaellum component FlaC